MNNITYWHFPIITLFVLDYEKISVKYFGYIRTINKGLALKKLHLLEIGL